MRPSTRSLATAAFAAATVLAGPLAVARRDGPLTVVAVAVAVSCLLAGARAQPVRAYVDDVLTAQGVA